MRPEATGQAALRRPRVVLELTAAVARERLLVVVVGTFVVSSALVGPFVGWAGPVAIGTVFMQTAIVTTLALVGLVINERLRRWRDLPAREGYALAWLRLRKGPLSLGRLTSFVVVAALLSLEISMFTGWKVWLNHHVSFTWDPAFIAIDKALHFGRHPWAMTPSFLSSEVTEAIYTLGWFAVVQGTTITQAFASPSAARTRFLVASALAWPIAGNVLAGLFMSAGPWFDARIAPKTSPFAPVDSIARAVGSRTWFAQDYLWRSYHDPDVAAAGSGVSAMPSMHLVMATLVAALLWHRGGVARALGVTFVLVILIGSVALGWHYAIDSYAGILLGLLFWWVAGRLIESAPSNPSNAT